MRMQRSPWEAWSLRSVRVGAMLTAATRGALGTLPLGSATAQAAASPETERAEYVAWLTSAPTSPLAALAQQPIGAGLTLGPRDADVPLEGIAAHRVTQQAGSLRLHDDAGNRPLARGQPFRLGRYTLTVDGPPGRAVLTVFGADPHGKPPRHYSRRPDLVFVGRLLPAVEKRTVRVLGVDGIEADAAEAGTVILPVGPSTVRLTVRRLPTPSGEESELEIFFRDATNGQGTYPAGRFVSLLPVGGGRYRLDLNRARNPYCAYSSAYPCPAPWKGNVIPIAIEAGEQYAGGGADTSSVGAR